MPVLHVHMLVAAAVCLSAHLGACGAPGAGEPGVIGGFAAHPPVRIRPAFQFDDGTSSEAARAMMRDVVVPQAIARVGGHLKIRAPVEGPLLLPRTCHQSWYERWRPTDARRARGVRRGHD